MAAEGRHARRDLAVATERHQRDHGSFVLVLAVVIVLAGVVSFGTVRLGMAVVLSDRAQTAADAAALAGVDGGRSRAGALAAANGATLTDFSRVGGTDGWTVTVRVDLGGVSARARASSQP